MFPPRTPASSRHDVGLQPPDHEVETELEALTHGDFHGALRAAMWVQIGLVAIMLPLSTLLPRHAREEGTAAVPAPEAPVPEYV